MNPNREKGQTACLFFVWLSATQQTFWQTWAKGTKLVRFTLDAGTITAFFKKAAGLPKVHHARQPKAGKICLICSRVMREPFHVRDPSKHCGPVGTF
jgi:hypothetical protein